MAESPRITPPSQLIVDTVEVRRHTGTRRPFVAATRFPDLVAGEFSVVDGRIDVDLVIEAVTEGVSATGYLRGRWTGPCRRCLDPIERPLEIEVREIFERQPTEGETWPIEDERIDLAPVIRESALLALPLVPLCGEDCEGPEPERFPANVEADVDLVAEEPPPDPRWAALDELRFDDGDQ
ncbi:MAG: DUF177 domain-containing protein [Acidimicrobiales bacterium]|nr:DUF177 domain-containing protein [Acidimicrobiales bacterium]